MKILVCVTKSPDTTAKIAFTDNNTKFAQDGVQWIINPYDEWYALVRAIELKEKDTATIIHLVTVGAADAEPIIRKALALGGDEAIRVNADTHDSFSIASQIADVAKQGAYDLIFTGIVPSKRQIPIPKHAVQVFEIAGSCSGRLFKIRAFIYPPVHFQIVTFCGS